MNDDNFGVGCFMVLFFMPLAVGILITLGYLFEPLTIAIFMNIIKFLNFIF